jgi:hypothetical protein
MGLICDSALVTFNITKLSIAMLCHMLNFIMLNVSKLNVLALFYEYFFALLMFSKRFANISSELLGNFIDKNVPYRPSK